MKFTHLHLHTEFSLLDGTVRVQPLVEKLKALGMDSCAISDHGTLSGAYKFWKALKGEGIKPIIGCEVYVAPRTRFDKESGVDNKYMHLLLLAKNLEGYKNLMKIVSIGQIEGYYYKPRVDWEVLEKYNEGIITTSACMGGVVSKPIMESNPRLALENAKRLAKIYEGNFYIEIQRNGVDGQDALNDELLKIAKELSLPIVATCDVHYLEKEDRLVQEILWCIADGKTLDDPTRRQFGTEELYLKSVEQMEELFKDLPEAIENTQKIADQVELYELTFGRVEPHFLKLPEGKTSHEYLRELTYAGVEGKYGELTEDLKKRIELELTVIHDKQYDDYFLIMRDFILFAKERGIVVGMRGSGCASVVAYLTDIIHIEPLGWQLYFERFLNPERMSPPDFDIDISDARRDEVIAYVVEMYGAENVSQIGTFSKLQTRQAIRDISRVLGIDLTIADKLSKMVKIEFGKSKNIDYMIENDKEFAQIINSTPALQEMAKIVRKISGMCRGVSKHACGILITPKPVVEYVPLQRDAHGEGMPITQFEMGELEDVGVMKFDFLGLRNLNVIGETVEKIKDVDPQFDLANIDFKDGSAFKLIQEAQTVGVFQLEGEGMRKAIRSLRPSSLEEICYLLSAYRPGPMQFIPEYVEVKEGKKKAEYPLPALEPILKITNGVITYQEQVLKMAVDIAGYTMGGADMLRRAIGKKKMDVMEGEKVKFIEGAVERGHPRDKVEIVWDRIVQFANYGFNKAHAASYAVTCYWTAFLKSHYPLQFMSSLLEGDLDNFERVVIDMADCERMGIKILTPDINKSSYKFIPEGKSSIRFGLAAIKNVGEDIVKELYDERLKNGDYLNLDDLIYRNINKKLTKRATEYLIMAGAMDSFGDRMQLLDVVSDLFDRYKQEKATQMQGQFDLFNGGQEKVHIEQASPLGKTEPLPVYKRLEWEKELLGIYLTSHPLDDLKEFFESKGAIPISELHQMKPGGKIVVTGGIVSKIRRTVTKKEESMAFLTIEDKTGSIDAVLFPRVYEELKGEIMPNQPMLFAGRVNEKDNNRSFIVEKAKNVDEAKHGSNFEGVVFKINGVHTQEEVVELKRFIKENPGDTPVKIVISSDGESREMTLKSGIALNDLAKKYIARFA